MWWTAPLWYRVIRHMRTVSEGFEYVPDNSYLYALADHFEGLGLGLPALLSASDAELLAAKGFGPRSLAQFRKFVPQRYTVPRSDPWREHVEMIAGVT
jgi:hypothetical protein